MMDSILIIAGENSGEKYGANLVNQFKQDYPRSQFKFWGIGGQEMEAAGVKLHFSVKDLAVVGIFEIISHLPRLKRIMQHIAHTAKDIRPRAAVLIDSPDFNLRLARKLKRLSIPVLYYVSPTVWAWRKNRLRSIKKYVTKMMLIFPFEEQIYADRKIPAVYIGHPLLEKLHTSLTKKKFFQKYELNPHKKLIALLPGSRQIEIRNHMPALIKAVEEIRTGYTCQFLLLCAENLSVSFLKNYIPPGVGNIKILHSDHYDALAASDLALSACGTANLEAALLETPVIAFYKVSNLSYAIGIRFVKIKYYSIVNILAGTPIIPELIQKNFTAKNLSRQVSRLLGSPALQTEMINKFKEIRSSLGEKKASAHAAGELGRLLDLPSPPGQNAHKNKSG